MMKQKQFQKEIKERVVSILERMEKQKALENGFSLNDRDKQTNFVPTIQRQHYKNLKEYLNRNSELIKKLFYDYGLSLREIENLLEEDYGRKIEPRKIRQILVKEFGRKLVESRITNIKAHGRRFEKFLRLLKLDGKLRKQFLDVLFDEDLGKTAKYQKLKDIIDDYFFKKSSDTLDKQSKSDNEKGTVSSNDFREKLITKTVKNLTKKEGTLGWLIFEKFHRIFVEPYEQLKEQMKIDVNSIKETYDELIEQTPLVELVQEFFEEEQQEENIIPTTLTPVPNNSRSRKN